MLSNLDAWQTALKRISRRLLHVRVTTPAKLPWQSPRLTEGRFTFIRLCGPIAARWLLTERPRFRGYAVMCSPDFPPRLLQAVLRGTFPGQPIIVYHSCDI